MADFLADPQASAELPGWIEYERLEEERQTNRLIYAIVRAFNGDGKQGKSREIEDDEEVIDTTQPEFSEHFKGFINVPQGQQRPRPVRQTSTQIIMG